MIGIVVVNFRTWTETVNCVDSILKTCTLPYKIYIVDSFSPNDSFERLSEKYQGIANIEMIQAGEKSGYSRNLNRGFKRALEDNCSIYIASNNDIVYLENSIENLVSLLESSDDIAVVGSQLIDNQGNKQHSAGWPQTFGERLIQTTPLKKIFKKKAEPIIDVSEPTEVVYVNGGCFALKMDFLVKNNGFDDNVFLYCEERILGKGVEKQNMKLLINPNAVVIHDHSATVSPGSAYAYIEFCKSDLYYCKEYLDINGFQVATLRTVRTLIYLLKCYRKDYREHFSHFRKEYF